MATLTCHGVVKRFMLPKLLHAQILAAVGLEPGGWTFGADAGPLACREGRAQVGGHTT
jgi:hypothetical protein